MIAARVRRDRGGQAAVELALALPVVVLFVLGAVQVALVARDRVAIELAAREGARAASVSADPVGAATAAARRATRLEPIDVAVELIGDTVRVTVRFVDPTDVALIGDVIAPVAMQASAVMALEPPAPGAA